MCNFKLFGLSTFDTLCTGHCTELKNVIKPERYVTRE